MKHSKNEQAVKSRIFRLAKRQGLKAAYWTTHRGTARDVTQNGWHFSELFTNALLSGEQGLTHDEAVNWLEAEA